MNFAAILNDIDAALRPHAGEQGHVATYIPALARVPADRFGIALCTVDGIEAGAGHCDLPFSIQSVSKVFSLTMALQAVGDELWKRVGREPSGNPFNSLVQLESEHGKPRRRCHCRTAGRGHRSRPGLAPIVVTAPHLPCT